LSWQEAHPTYKGKLSLLLISFGAHLIQGVELLSAHQASSRRSLSSVEIDSLVASWFPKAFTLEEINLV
jgi:hypothetical protein